jgi:hypothetical protein
MPITDEDIVRDLLHRYTDHVQPRDSIATAVIARQRRRDRNRRLASAAAAGAALATAAGVIAVLPGPAPRAPQSPGNALPTTRQPVTSRPATRQPALKLTADQRALSKLSAVAARQPAAQGRYAVMMTDGTDVKDTNIIDTRTGDLWGYQLGADGYPSGGGSVTRHFSPTAAQFAAMPTDPTALRAALIAQWNKQTPALPDPYHGGRITPLPFTNDDKVFQQANNVLWNPLSGPALRSALFRVLMNVPGVKVTWSAHDADGRPAVEISRADASGLPGYKPDGQTWATYESPATGALLETSITFPPGEVTPQYPHGSPYLFVDKTVYQSITWANKVPSDHYSSQ